MIMGRCEGNLAPAFQFTIPACYSAASSLSSSPSALATPAPAPDSIRASDLQVEKLILLEEGHCLRDQALAVCGAVGKGARSKFGATSLTTVLQMVANGYGSTLLPEMAVPVEVRADTPLALHHLVPEPSRTIGLVWRASAPRLERFERLARLFLEVWRVSNPGYKPAN